MKVLILILIVALGHCVSRQKKDHLSDMREGESYMDYKSRKVRSQIYNIPNGKCYLVRSSLEDAYCQVRIDSCCYTTHRHVCWPSYGLEGEVEGHCHEYVDEDGPLSQFFNGTLYGPVE